MPRVHSAKRLGDIVRGRRTELGWTQSDLAAETGVSRKWIIDVEAGKSTAAVGLILKLLDALDIELDATPREHARTDREAWPNTTTVDLDMLLDRYKPK